MSGWTEFMTWNWNNNIFYSIFIQCVYVEMHIGFDWMDIILIVNIRGVLWLFYYDTWFECMKCLLVIWVWVEFEFNWVIIDIVLFVWILIATVFIWCLVYMMLIEWKTADDIENIFIVKKCTKIFYCFSNKMHYCFVM